MKYLKKFENFDLGRFNDEDEEKKDLINNVERLDCESCDDEGCELCDDVDLDEEDTDEEEVRRRVWGDEVVEKKKINPGFQAYLDKQKDKNSKKEDKDDKKSDKDKKDTKNSKKEEKKEDKEEIDNKGLSAKQKKLPIALQKSILAKKKK